VVVAAGRAGRALPGPAADRRLAAVGVQVSRASPLRGAVNDEDLDELQRPGALQAAHRLRVPTAGEMERRREHLYAALPTERQGKVVHLNQQQRPLNGLQHSEQMCATLCVTVSSIFNVYVILRFRCA